MWISGRKTKSSEKGPGKYKKKMHNYEKIKVIHRKCG